MRARFCNCINFWRKLDLVRIIVNRTRQCNLIAWRGGYYYSSQKSFPKNMQLKPCSLFFNIQLKFYALFLMGLLFPVQCIFLVLFQSMENACNQVLSLQLCFFQRIEPPSLGGCQLLCLQRVF